MRASRQRLVTVFFGTANAAYLMDPKLQAILAKRRAAADDDDADADSGPAWSKKEPAKVRTFSREEFCPPLQH